MTAPHVQFGNIGTDIGSGADTFIQGLIGQRQRQAQIAMQQALASARTGLETEQGNVAGQTAATAAHANEPAGADQEAQLQQILGPNYRPGMLGAANRAEADEYIHWAQMAHMMGMRLGMTGSSQIINRFNAQVRPHLQAMDAYTRVNDMLSSGSALTPTMAVGALTQLAVPNNAREASTMLTQMRSGQLLGGPFTATENIWNRLGKVFNTQGNTLDANAMQEVRAAAQSLIRGHMMLHDNFKQTALNQAQALGIPMDPNELEADDPFAAVRGGPAVATPAPGQTPPAAQGGTGGWNPRFAPGQAPQQPQQGAPQMGVVP
jgi:hypothetical protein